MLTPIGQTLKAAREARGLSLLDAAHETRIPVAKLHLLEQDNYPGFGSMTYARAFLRRYSQYLQVDAAEILNELPSGVLGGPRDYRYLIENHGDWVSPRGSIGRLSSPQVKGRASRSPVHAGLFIFLLVLAGTAIWGNYVADDRLTQQEEPPFVPMPDMPAQPLSASARPAPFGIENQPVKILKAIPVPELDESGEAAGNVRQVE
jgi:cytoskeletal protein RodZ